VLPFFDGSLSFLGVCLGELPRVFAVFLVVIRVLSFYVVALSPCIPPPMLFPALNALKFVVLVVWWFDSWE
jgi:hypothetical protein